MSFGKVRTHTIARIIGPLGGGTTRPYLVESVAGGKFAMKLPADNWRCQLVLNEFLAGILLERINLPTPMVVLLQFGQEFHSEECDTVTRNRIVEAERNCNPLICLGTEFADDYHDVGPSVIPDSISNFHDALGAVVFDTWVFNQDARHYLGQQHADGWHLMLFDNDGAFNRNDWILHDRVRIDTNCTVVRERLLAIIRERGSLGFDNWLTALEDDSRWQDLSTLAELIPHAWTNNLLAERQYDVAGLLSCLNQRRHRIRSIIQQANM